MKRRLIVIGLALHAATLLAAPTSQPYRDTQSALSPAGVAARNIDGLWWRTFYLTVGVYGLVLLFTIIPLWLRREKNFDAEPVAPTAPADRKLLIAVSTATALTVVVLFILIISDFIVGNKNRALAREPDQMVIRFTGHQWWWEVRYDDPISSKIATDANEIHVPVGEPVRIELQSADVIHSFWVPNISGKKDMIPGHPTLLTIKAEREGTYWGQCAEYCGHEHAKMRFAFVVQNRHDFDAWRESATQSAPKPQTEQQKRGLNVFLGRTCSMCHTIQGTPAGGRLGPELTHVASRATLAAGSLPNSMGHLGGWIIDPQGLKPGVRMPLQTLSQQDLQDLLEYLETLK